jgi:GTPase
MPRISDPAILITKAGAGDRRSLARLISLVEDGGPVGIEIVASVFPTGGRAWTTGLTGAPGAGKSTITDRLLGLMREGGNEVAVVAVDPSSPFSGGAVLGDRVRMQGHVDDPGVYVRSMASRGHLGGISAATPRVVALLDGIGFPEIVVETVGVGQAEVEIAGNADTTVVVVNPGWGDSVQAAKAGLLEIGDIFVVNKADRPGVNETIRDLTQMLELGDPGDWSPPILATVGTTGEGVSELWSAIRDHRGHLEKTGELRQIRSRRLVTEMESFLMGELRKRIRQATSDQRWDDLTRRVAQRVLDPWSAANLLLRSGVASE